MTRVELEELEALLEKMDADYGERIHNDRYVALAVVKETVCSLLIS